MRDTLRRLDAFFLLNQHGRFIALEGLRAWAILSVFCVHFNADWSARKLDHPGLSLFLSSVTFGHLGVDLFFVLSGFLIYRLITTKRPGFVQFLMNRYQRLLPAHVAVILLAMTASPLWVNLANISFLNYFAPAIPTLNFITWSLSYEILFYAFCALALITLDGFLPGKLWLAAFAAGLLAAFFLLPAEIFSGRTAYRLPDVRFMAFFAGIAAAIFYESRLFKRWQGAIPVLGAAGFILGVVLSRYVWGEHHAAVQRPPFTNLFYLASAVAFALVCLAAVTDSASLVKKCFSSRPLRILGMVSYSFYLSHALISIPLANRVTDQFPQARTYGISFVLSLAVATLVSVFLFHFLEKPYFASRAIRRSEDAR